MLSHFSCFHAEWFLFLFNLHWNTPARSEGRVAVFQWLRLEQLYVDAEHMFALIIMTHKTHSCKKSHPDYSHAYKAKGIAHDAQGWTHIPVQKQDLGWQTAGRVAAAGCMVMLKQCIPPACGPRRSSSNAVILRREPPKALAQVSHPALREWQPILADLPLERAASQGEGLPTAKAKADLSTASKKPRLRSAPSSQFATALVSVWSYTCFTSSWAGAVQSSSPGWGHLLRSLCLL